VLVCRRRVRSSAGRRSERHPAKPARSAELSVERASEASVTAVQTGRAPPNAATSTVATVLLRREREVDGREGTLGEKWGGVGGEKS
jgi:hypothetical protein